MADDYRDHTRTFDKVRHMQVMLKPGLFGTRLMVRTTAAGQPEAWGKWRKASRNQVAVANSFLRQMWIM